MNLIPWWLFLSFLCGQCVAVNFWLESDPYEQAVFDACLARVPDPDSL